MCNQYDELVTGLKSLYGCPFAENGWDSRPETDNWGVVTCEFEPDALHGDDRKVCRAFEGSVDLFSKKKDGDSYVQQIEETLNVVCGGCWHLNSHQWERENDIFHWEWVFQVED